jgi:hypothetical protein
MIQNLLFLSRFGLGFTRATGRKRLDLLAPENFPAKISALFSLLQLDWCPKDFSPVFGDKESS